MKSPRPLRSRPGRRWPAVAAVAAAALLTVWLRAQNKVESAPPPAPIRAAAERVVVPVTVFSPGNVDTGTLEKKDLRLLVDGKEVSDFSLMSDRAAPAAVGILIDASSTSVGRQLPWVRKFLEGFFHHTDQKDSIFIAAYGLHWDVLAPPTADRTALLDCIFNMDAGLMKNAKTKWAGPPDSIWQHVPFKRGFPANKTAIALDSAYYELAQLTPPRKAIVLVSDGDENLSNITLDHIRFFGSPIYTVYAGGAGIGERTLFRRGSMINKISSESGGAIVQVRSDADATAKGRSIADLVRNQHVISFVPPDSIKRSGTHSIRVESKVKGQLLTYRRSFRFTRD